MAWVPNTTPRDDAADAARFLTRLAYAVLAIGAPVGLLLHPIALYLLFPVGVALLIFAAALDPSAIERRRWPRIVRSPVALLILALLAWAALSILWTPFRVEAWQQSLRYLGMLVASRLRSGFRPAARARHRNLHVRGRNDADDGDGVRFLDRDELWRRFRLRPPWRGRLADRYARLPGDGGSRGARARRPSRALLVLALIFLYAINAPGVMIAFLTGFATLAFAFARPERTAREMGWIGAVSNRARSPVRARRPTAVAAHAQREAARPAAALSRHRLRILDRDPRCAQTHHRTRFRDGRPWCAGRRPACADAARRPVPDLVRTGHRRRLDPGGDRVPGVPRRWGPFSASRLI